ncbi:MAG: cation diffusion facilitator family transporter [Erysipelotrichaceae bacterium]|nr:cation diffusion facilitator family transporter [Erysipelotrichaceae bacterium]
MKSDIREKEITRTSMIGIAANVLLAGFKAAVGLLAGAISIVLDAINNLTDVVSSVITIIGIKLAKRKPDNKHPFGHGRVEYLSAIIIALIVLLAGISSLVESVKNIIHPKMPDYTSVTIIVIVAAVIVKFFLGRYVKAQGEKYKSNALIASGSDASFDAVITASTLLGVVAAKLFNVSIDGILGAVISAFIIKAGVEMLMESLGSIIGVRFDDGVAKEIKAYICTYEGVLGAYDLVVHNYGPDYALGSVHVEVDSKMTAFDIYKLTARIQKGVMAKFNIYLSVAIYAIDAKKQKIRDKIRDIALSHEGVVGCHGIFIDDQEKYVSFDIVVDFTTDHNEIREKIKKEVKELLKDHEVVINIDLNYTD